MRVVYIADKGLAGGATKSLIELVNTMKKEQGIDAVVLTSDNTEMNDKLTANNIENYAVGHGAFMQGAPDAFWKKPIKWVLFAIHYYTHFYPSLKKALNVIDWSKVDLIHTNVARDDLGMEISKRTGVPNICHIREFAELDFNCWSYRMNYVKYLNKNTNGFIAISEAVKDYWIKKGISEKKIKVIYNGVDGKSIKHKECYDKKNSDTLKMVIVGGVIPNKGQWQAIEALCKLPENIRQKCTLDVIGGITESYKRKLMKPLVKLGIENQVAFLGARSDVYERLKDYDIGLMCSKAEGFGRVTVEYMHAGLAVIASNCGANPELISTNKYGLLYEYNNAKDLSSKIKYLYDNRDKMEDFSKKGQIFAQNNFTAGKNAKNIMAYYLNFLKGDIE